MRPCLFCGCTESFVIDMSPGCSDEYCSNCKENVDHVSYVNAWAHRRIEALEAKIETLTEVAGYFERQLVAARL